MTIVLGYDESPGATRALQYAIDLAKLLDDTLVLVYGAEPPSRMGEEFKDHLRAIEEQGRAALAQAVEATDAALAHATDSAITGPLRDQMVHVLQQNADQLHVQRHRFDVGD